MWTYDQEELTDHPSGASALRFRPPLAGRALTTSEVVRGWAGDAAFRRAFHGLLREIPYEAYLWETPPVSRDDIDRPFEFVAVDSPVLARLTADAEPFREHYVPGRPVVTFESLGRDAVLVAPCPGEAPYPHLAAFVSHAPEPAADAIWRSVGEAMSAHLGDAPIWLSTSGLGVAWLHVRLDSRPKYYAHTPYRKWPRSPAG